MAKRKLLSHPMMTEELYQKVRSALQDIRNDKKNKHERNKNN